jgi:hypothetical protein
MTEGHFLVWVPSNKESSVRFSTSAADGAFSSPLNYLLVNLYSLSVIYVFLSKDGAGC